MVEKIMVEVDLGKKAVERCAVAIYLNGKLVGDYADRSYGDLPLIAAELKAEYQDAEIEVWCLGEDCAGRTWRWKIDV